MDGGKRALITGASSGIGKATALQFAERGYDLALLARRKDLLDALCEQLKTDFPRQEFRVFLCDISNAEQVSSIAKELEGDWSSLNLLINNAGVFEWAPLEKSQLLDQLIDVNVKGTLYVTRAFLPLLRNASKAEGSAKILNVSSISGKLGGAGMAAYCASKFAVRGFSSALRRELARERIDVSTIYPGPVNNKVLKESELQGPKKGITMFPNQIAKQIWELAHGTKRSLISHPALVALSACEPFSPRLVDALFKRLMK